MARKAWNKTARWMGRVMLAGVSLWLAAGPARGQTEYGWAGGSGTWSDGTRWLGGNPPPEGGAADLTLSFGGAAAFSAGNDLPGRFILNQLVLSNTVDGATNVISGNGLVFAASSAGIAPLALQAASGVCLVTSPATLATTTTLGGDGALAVWAGNLDGTGTLVKAGAGLWELSGNNTYSGGTVVAAGTLDVRGSNALAVGTVAVSNGAALLLRNAIGPSTPVALSMAGKYAFASTNALQAAGLAIDGNAATRWESQHGVDPQWWYVDLGQTCALSQVQINWEAARARDFSIQVSDSTNEPPGGAGWTIVYATNNNPATPGADYTYPLAAGASGRYVAMYGNTRMIGYGYSMYEFKVFTPGTAPLTFAFPALNGGATATLDAGRNIAMLGGSGSASYAGAITGTSVLIKTGSGTQLLTGDSRYAGGTIVSNGTLGIGQDTSLGLTNTAVFLSGATLEATNAISSSVRTLTLTNGALLAVDAQSSLVWNGPISGPGPLVKQGPGTLLLAVANTYGGGTWINSGTLSVTSTASFGSGGFAVVQPGATLEFARGDTLAGGAGSPTFTLTNNSGTIINTPGRFNALGPLLLNGGTLASTGGNSVGYQAYQFRSPVVVTGDAPSWMISSGANSSFHLAPGGTIFDVAAGAASTNLVVAARLIDPDVAVGGSGGVTKTGGGVLALTAANNGYTGPTVVNQGTLLVSADGNLGQAPAAFAPSNVVLNGGVLGVVGTFVLSANRGVMVGPTNGSGSGTIQVAADQTLCVSGLLRNNGAGSGGLTKAGAGTLLLSTNAAYSGPTVVSAGTLQIGPPSAPPTGCRLWLDATRGVTTDGALTNGAPVRAWQNQGDGGDAVYGHATYATGAVNGLPVVRFDGVNQSLTSAVGVAYANTNATLAIFMVDLRRTNTVDFTGPMSLIGTGHTTDWNDSYSLSLDWGTVVQNPGVLRTFRAGAQLSSTTHPAFGTPYYWDSVFDGANNQLALNGVSAASMPSAGPFGIDRVSVGSRLGAAGPNSFFSGDIGEILIYNGPVNRPLVEAYLAAKWFGVGLSPNLLPTNTELAVAEGAIVALSVNQAVASVAGGGRVTGSGLLTTGMLQPGGSNSVGTLTVDNLALVPGATYRWDAASTTGDVVVVKQAVSLPAAMTVAVNAAGGTPVLPYTILTFGTNTGATAVSFTVTGGSYSVRLRTNSVVVDSAMGSALIIQ